MNTGEIVLLVIIALCAVLSLVISLLHFMQKGCLLNNAYLLASEKERETMDQKPYYIQSGVIFLMVFFVLLLMGLNLLTGNTFCLLVEIGLLIFSVVFAFGSSKKIQKNQSNQRK